MNARLFFRLDLGRTSAGGVSAMTPVLSALHGMPIKGAVSFELHTAWRQVQLCMSCPAELAGHLTTQMHAQHPGIVLSPCDDPVTLAQPWHGSRVVLAKPELQPLKTGYTDNCADQLTGVFAALGATNDWAAVLQVVFEPVGIKAAADRFTYLARLLARHHPQPVERLLASPGWWRVRRLTTPLRRFACGVTWLFRATGETAEITPNQASLAIKMQAPCFRVRILIGHAGPKAAAIKSIPEIGASLAAVAEPLCNHLSLRVIKLLVKKDVVERSAASGYLLNALELAGLVHVPTTNASETLHASEAQTLAPPLDLARIDPAEGIIIGATNHRGPRVLFGLSADDRRRHVYVLGKTGMGKTTLLEKMILADMEAWRGLAVIDPHGDLAQAVIGLMAKSRTNHTIIFDPSDSARPIGFNMLEAVDAERRPLVASGLVGIFKKLFHDSWGPRLEHTLRSAILALLEFPGATLLSIPLLLTNDAYRAKVVERVTDPVVKAFWIAEFGRLNPTQRTETVSPILNKVGQFLSSPLLRNILGQPQSAFSLRRAMDQGKTVIINLSKGKIGEDASTLLGAMLVTKFQLDAMSRADMPESERRDFTLYVDEFQNFATDSFATILSEARKYRLSLVMANQYVEQMPDAMRAAVFGNVGSVIAFQVGPADAPFIKEALQGDVTERDLLNAPRHTAYVRLTTNGMPTRAFSAAMLPPLARRPAEMVQQYSKGLQVNREKYAKPRAFVADKIAKLIDQALTDDSRSQKPARAGLR